MGDAPDGEDAEPVESYSLPPGDLKDKILALFKQFDADGTGKILIKTIDKVKVSVGPTDKKVLSYMHQMDANGDGFVEQDEWELYFAVCLQTCNDGDLETIMKDLQEGASTAATIANCSKIADDGDMQLTEEEEENAAAALEECAAALTPEQLKLVTSLFELWDFNGDGHIDRGKLMTKGVEVGPHHKNFFGELDKMDVDQDGKVTLKEMVMYLGAVAQLMSEAEWTSMVKSMMDIASMDRTIVDCVAKADGGDGPAMDDDDDMMPELSEARAAKVKALFLKLSNSLSEPVAMCDLENVKVDAGGGHVMNALKDLKVMDANGDGQLEFDEMLVYFRVLGAEYEDDTPFNVVIDSLTDAVSALISLKTAQAMDA